MQVSEETRKAYASGESVKTMRIFFPDINLTIENNKIHSETMNLKESLMEGNNVEFVGCIASSFELTIHGVLTDLKNQRIEVYIKANNTEEIPLFHGIVNSAKMQTNKNYKKIVAYDELTTKGNIDVASWYNGLAFPISLKNFRNSLFSYIGIAQAEKDLPNDEVIIDKQYAPNTLQALSVIKAICQINGAFGIINRQNKFEYRILKEMFEEDDSFPPLYPPFYPGTEFSGGGAEQNTENFAFYRSVDYEEYKVKPVERVTIRQSAEDAGVTYGSGTNNYIIQANMFATGLTEDDLISIAKNIHDNVAGVSFQPFSASNNGMPWIEVGESSANYTVVNYSAIENQTQRTATEQGIPYTEKKFYIFNRELKGIQSLTDNYTVQGNEYQTEFITDLQTQIDSIKSDTQQIVNNTVKDYTYSKQEIDDLSKSWYRIVTAKPTTFEQGVIYFVRK